MADTTVTPVAAPQQFNQVLKDIDPQGTEVAMRAAGMSMTKYGSCSASRMHRALPEEERVRGCPCWKECTLTQIKGKAGPVNLPYRLYKKDGKIREGWGPCFTVFRMAAQYNLGNENFVMEILPPGSPVEVRISKPLPARPDGSQIWEEEIEKQIVPPFPKLGDRGHLIHEQQAAKVRKALMDQRRQKFIDTTMGLKPEDVEASQAPPSGTGKAG